MTAETSFLAEIPLFATLEDDERVVLAGQAAARSLSAGETLFRAGQPGDAMFIVRQGAVELFATDTSGNKIVFHTAQPGEYFGELSLIDGGPRTATAVATEETELLAVDREDLLQLFRRRPEAAIQMLTSLGGMTRRANALLAKHGIRNVNQEIETKSTFSEKIADLIAAWSGSMEFFYINGCWFGMWILWNTVPWRLRFDPFPFGLLTMIVSLEAIFLACFVLISQNRQAAKDRVRSDVEYETNIKAELEVAHLHEKTDHLHVEVLEALSRIEKKLRASGS